MRDHLRRAVGIVARVVVTFILLMALMLAIGFVLDAFDLSGNPPGEEASIGRSADR